MYVKQKKEEPCRTRTDSKQIKTRRASKRRKKKRDSELSRVVVIYVSEKMGSWSMIMVLIIVFSSIPALTASSKDKKDDKEIQCTGLCRRLKFQLKKSLEQDTSGDSKDNGNEQMTEKPKLTRRGRIFIRLKSLLETVLEKPSQNKDEKNTITQEKHRNH